MASSTNSFLRGQRKPDLLELAETVGLKKYVQTRFLLQEFFILDCEYLIPKIYCCRIPLSRHHFHGRDAPAHCDNNFLRVADCVQRVPV